MSIEFILLYFNFLIDDFDKKTTKKLALSLFYILISAFYLPIGMVLLVLFEKRLYITFMHY